MLPPRPKNLPLKALWGGLPQDIKTIPFCMAIINTRSTRNAGRPANKSEIIALVGVIALAALLRCGWPGVNSFSFDEARVSQMALQMARGGEFAALGMQSSTGVPNFPAAVWIFALPYWLTPNPLAATLFASLLNTLAVVGVWWLAREAWGTWAAWSAALLYAVSPYTVYYSRSIWSQNLLAPLAVLWAVLGVWGISKEKNWAIALYAFLAGFVLQVHLAGLALALASLWLGLRFGLWRRWKAVALGVSAALLTAAPTLYTIWRYGRGAKAELGELLQRPFSFQWNGFHKLAKMGLGLNGERFWLGSSWQWPEPLETAPGIASIVIALGIGVGLVVITWRAIADIANKSGPQAGTTWIGGQVLTALLPIWAISAPLLFVRSKTPVYPQYQLTSLPALFLMAGAAANLLRRRWWRVAITAVALAAAVVQSVTITQALTLVKRELYPGGMGTPLLYPQSAVSTLKQDNKPIVVHTHGDVVEYHGDAAVFQVLLWEYPHRIVDGRSVLLIPKEPAHLLFTFADLPAWKRARDLGLVGAVRELPRRENEPPYLALAVDGVDLPTLEPAGPFLLENGAQLLNWKLHKINVSGRLRLITHWQINNPIVEGHYQQFNHLYLEGEPTPHAVHDVSTSSRAWRPGDHLIIWADFAAPEAPPAHFDVGMYTWPDLQRSPVLHRAGDPLAPIRLEVKLLEEPPDQK